MADVVDTVTRNRMMSGIRTKNTKPEIIVRQALHKAGFRFRLHRGDLPGAPDVVLPKWRVALFVHGCFWHAHEGCRNAKVPSTRKDFWERKLMENVERDLRSRQALLAAGWRVLIVWECATRSVAIREALPELLMQWICGHELSGEFGLPSTLP